MTDFTIRIAEYNFRIKALHDVLVKPFAGYICSDAEDFIIETTTEDILYERAKHIKEAARENRAPESFPDYYYEFTSIQRKIANLLIDRGILLLHGSVVAVDGRAYLFTAKSGTGKSTHTRLWREQFGERAVMVNDDKPFIRISDEGALVYGTPWNGKHRLGSNICVPLDSICILERGPENRIRRISPSEAIPMLIQQSHRPPQPDLLHGCLDLIGSLAYKVKLWRMECTMDPEAAVISYETMSGKRKEYQEEN